MSMVPVRTFALRRLVAALEIACPALQGKIVPEADRDDKMKWPKCGIHLVRDKFAPHQRRRHARLSAGEVVFDVGHFEALVQLRLGAPTQRQRIDLGEQLLGAFLGDGDTPGILSTAIPEVNDAVCAWEVDDEGWNNEFAFDKEWFQVLTVTGWIPALVRTAAYQINDLRLNFTNDMTDTPFASLQASAKEVIRVNDDGTITALP